MPRPDNNLRRGILVSPAVANSDDFGRFLYPVTGHTYTTLAVIDLFTHDTEWAAAKAITAGVFYACWLLRHDRMNKPPRHHRKR